MERNGIIQGSIPDDEWGTINQPDISINLHKEHIPSPLIRRTVLRRSCDMGAKKGGENTSTFAMILISHFSLITWSCFHCLAIIPRSCITQNLPD